MVFLALCGATRTQEGWYENGKQVYLAHCPYGFEMLPAFARRPMPT